MSVIKDIVSLKSNIVRCDSKVFVSLTEIHSCSLFEDFFRASLKNCEEFFVCHIFKQLKKYTQKESNLHQRIRNPLLYPLSYGCVERLTFEVDDDMFFAVLFQSLEDAFDHSPIFITKLIKVKNIFDPMLDMNMVD